MTPDEGEIRALVRRILLDVLAEEGKADIASPRGQDASMAGPRVIAIAADHGGYELKQQLIPWLQSLGYAPIDLGTHSHESVDYPDFAFSAASMVMQGKADAAIVIDGAGIGSAMAANKTPGVRASMCYDVATARNAREHNHANVLTLGASMIDLEQAKAIVKTWLKTPWGGGRHARRVAKITAIEQRFSKRNP
jgi:ribose 5-phosphate isomerase B